MSIPVDVTFRGLDPSPALKELAEEQAERLGRYYGDLIRCHITIERPEHRVRGNPYHVTLYLTLPGEDIVVNHQPQTESTLRQTAVESHSKSSEAGMQAKDPHLALREAFKRARRRMEDHVRRVRGKVKSHGEGPRGQVVRLFAEQGYGFIQTDDGREVYFHRNSLIGSDFDHLVPGTAVSFAEEAGEHGPQASTVRVIG